MLSKISAKSLIRRSFSTTQKAPKRVVVTGGAGQISYSLLFRIASGQFLGPDQPIILNVLDLDFMKDPLSGVQMELHDCAFDTLQEVNATTNQTEAFKDADYIFLVGAKPRGPGMERADLLMDNGKIFVDTGKAINDNASRDAKTIVVGNPANTNALICSHHAKDIPKENFTAMTRLDHNRALTQLALQTNSSVTDIENMVIWGNHSPTMYPDVRGTTVAGKAALDLVDRTWYEDSYIPKVQQRGAEIIQARKLSSAASAGNAALDHMRDWVFGSSEVLSMAVPSAGNPYGVPEGLVFSFPCKVTPGKYEIIPGYDNSDAFSQQKIKATTDELLQERDMVSALLN